MNGTIPRLRSLLKDDRFEALLRELVALFARLETNSKLSGTSFPFPQFDEFCEQVGRSVLFSANPTPFDYDHDLVLITEAMVQGGHAEIIKDIADCAALPLVIVASNLYDRKDPVLSELRDHPRVAAVVVCETEPLLARLGRVQALIAHPAAKRIMVLCHGNDAVSIAAVAPVDDRPVLFFHHCDHTPSLGCFLKRAVHIDLHNLGFHHCGAQLGIDPRYICLTSGAATSCRSSGEYAKPVFKSATCGGEHKMVRLHYPMTYQDLVVRTVAARRGVHYHVGLLSTTFVENIWSALRDAELPEDAFVHVGHVSGLQKILEVLEIDLYLPTLPQSGGKALIDAMSAGVPILIHENATDRLWGGRDLVYPEAPSWSNLKEFDTRLRRYDDDGYWRQQSLASRSYFERYHARSLFSQMLEANGALAGSEPPPLKPYRPDFDKWASLTLGDGANGS